MPTIALVTIRSVPTTMCTSGMPPRYQAGLPPHPHYNTAQQRTCSQGVTMLEVGQPAPPFSLQSDTEETVSLDDLKGRSVVVYFYPKDHTHARTRQACSIRDSWAEFGRSGADVIGVIPQSPKSHRKFK